MVGGGVAGVVWLVVVWLQCWSGVGVVQLEVGGCCGWM